MDNRANSDAGTLVMVGMLLQLLIAGGGFGYMMLARQQALRAQAELAAAQAQAEQARTLAEQAHAQAVLPANSIPSVDENQVAVVVKAMLRDQQEAWNAGDIDRFMQFYWRSEALTFSSSGETTRGWQATIDRYRKRYPTPEKMGQLEFGQLEVTPLSESAALVLGRWQLRRDDEPLRGNFTLVVRKIDDRWLIIHDHTSLLDDKDLSQNRSPTR